MAIQTLLLCRNEVVTDLMMKHSKIPDYLGITVSNFSYH